MNKATRPRWGTWQSTVWSLVGLGAGVAIGSVLGSHAGAHTNPLLTTLNGIGTLWVNALRMVALPLAVANTVCAMARERTGRAASHLGGAVAIYMALLLLGAAIVLLVVPPLMRATPVDHSAIAALSRTASAEARKLAAQPSEAPGLGDIVVGLVPRNLLQAAVNEDFLRLLIFAILFGLALRQISLEKRGTVIGFVEGVTETLMVLVRWIIWCAPLAMFALAATFAASSGTRLVGILGRFVLLECGLMLAYVLLLYPLTMVAGGLSFRRFASAVAGPQMVAVSTRSSLAALPAMLVAGEKMRLSDPEPARAVLPIAAGLFKVNRTTSALCRVLVIWHFWSVPAQPVQIYIFIATVILLSFSDLGLPGGTQFHTVPAYLAAGCPIEAVVLLDVIEPLSDICKTLLNVTGDLSVAAIVTRWSGRPVRARVMAAAATQAS
ncbi:MAG TPA: cation:dicarboxylase symporter family transporter [Bryobacteraceae bacterium]|nr:cation:dicarboxylase symporter family transporter [Bryobacteraceae bacterium]